MDSMVILNQIVNDEILKLIFKKELFLLLECTIRIYNDILTYYIGVMRIIRMPLTFYA